MPIEMQKLAIQIWISNVFLCCSLKSTRVEDESDEAHKENEEPEAESEEEDEVDRRGFEKTSGGTG